MRLSNGLVSGVLAGAAALLLAYGQPLQWPVTVGAVIVVALFGYRAKGAEAHDRIGFAVTLLLLFAVLWRVTLSIGTPGSWPSAGAFLVAGLIVTSLAHWWLEMEAGELGWRVPEFESVWIAAILAALCLPLLPHPPSLTLPRVLVIISIEFLFRGFLVSTLRSRLSGDAAIRIQAVAAALAGGSSWLVEGAWAFFAGRLKVRTGSLVPGLVMRLVAAAIF